MPRRSGGPFALSSGGSVNVNGALILFCHPERSRRISIFVQKFKTSLPTNLPSAGYRAQPRHFSSTFASPSTVSPTQWHREYHGNATSKPNWCNDNLE